MSRRTGAQVSSEHCVTPRRETKWIMAGSGRMTTTRRFGRTGWSSSSLINNGNNGCHKKANIRLFLLPVGMACVSEDAAEGHALPSLTRAASSKHTRRSVTQVAIQKKRQKGTLSALSKSSVCSCCLAAPSTRVLICSSSAANLSSMALTWPAWLSSSLLAACSCS